MKNCEDQSLVSRRGRPFTGDADWIAVTADMAALLRSEFARTGLDFRTFLQKAEDKPARLNARIVRGWLYGEAAKTDACHWRYVVALLASTPDGAGPLEFHERKPRAVFSNFADHRPISDPDIAALKFHRARTGVGGAVLLRDAKDKPPGLTAQMISSWMGEKPSRANPAHVRYVLALYRERISKT